jgi:protein-tyrosine phosphatase
MLDALHARGVRLSVTTGALSGKFGSDPRRFALDLLRGGMVDNVASDAHDAVRRPPGLAAPLDRVGWGSEIDRLCRAVPEAILAGRELPEASVTPAPEGRLTRLFRS